MAQLDDDVADFVAERRRRSEVRVLDSSDADKNKAAASVDLSNSTGADPGVVYNNYDEVARDNRNTMINSLASKDKIIENYINSHPLAASVSKDDWGNLAEFTGKLKDLATAGKYNPLPEIWEEISSAAKGAKDWVTEVPGVTKPFEVEPTSLSKGYSPELQAKLEEHLRKSGVRVQLTTPMWLYLQARYAAVIGAFRTWISKPLEEATGIPKDITEGLTLAGAAGLGIGAAAKGKGPLKVSTERVQAALQVSQDALTQAGPFMKAGEDPPNGMNKLIDLLKAEAAKVDLDKAKDLQKSAAATETRELSPDLFEKLIEQATKENIEVTWEGVKKMYGDKVPEPGDKMLGDVPNIQAQWIRSLVTGDAISMSKAHWLSKIDPKVWDDLADHYRDSPGSMSKTEIDTIKERTYPTAPKDLIGSVRTAAGLDPLLKNVLEIEAAKEAEKPVIERGAISAKITHDRYMRAIDERDAEDEAKHERDKLAEAKEKLSDWWNEEWGKKREEVAAEIENHPSFLLNDLFQYGKFRGDEFGGQFKVDPKYVYPASRTHIPDRFFKEGGVNPDILASEYGFATGHDAMDALNQFYKDKGDLGAKAWKEKVIERETDDRMEKEHGKLADLELNEVREHATGKSQFDILHQETLYLADKLGQKMSLTKQGFRAQAWERYNSSNAAKTNLASILREIGRAGRDAEDAFLKGDITRAFESKQHQTHLFAEAEYIKQFQRKVWKPLNQIVDTYKRAEVLGMPQEFLNHIQNLLHMIGETPKRTIGQIQAAMAEQKQQNLLDFAENYNKQFLPEGYEKMGVEYNPTIIITDFILEGQFNRTLNNMTVGESRAFFNLMQSLVKNGRNENKITFAGKTRDFEIVRGQAIEELEKLGEKPPPPVNWTRINKLTEFVRQMHIGQLQIEWLFSRWDFGDPRGFFSRFIYDPVIQASNEHDSMRKTFAKRLQGIKYKGDLTENLRNTELIDPLYVKRDIDGNVIGGRLLPQFNRENLIALMLNAGNESNLKVAAGGYAAKPVDVMNLIHRFASKEDWDFVRAHWKIFDDLQRLEDRMTMERSGSVLDKMPIGYVDTPHGRFRGGYYPLIEDYTRGFPGKDVMAGPKMVRIMTEHGWQTKRIGAIYPVDLHLSQIPQQIDRRLRHIAMHSVVSDMAKLFADKDVKKAITKYYGRAYADMPTNWLRDIVGQHGFDAASIQAASRMSEYFRQNTISTMIGWGPQTVEKHGLGALIQSMREVGPIEFWRSALLDLWASGDPINKANRKFLMEGGKVGNLDTDGFGELTRRTRDFQNTLGGAHEIQIGGEGGSWTSRERLMNAAAAPVAMVDMILSQATAAAKYRQVMKENIRKGMTPEESYPDAKALAERAVRNTHGSTSIASRPEFMRMQGTAARWLTSLANFYNHVYNRQFDMVWRIKEALAKVDRGQFMEAQKDMAKVYMDFVPYILVMAAVHEYYNPTIKKDDSWPMAAGKFLMQGFGAPVLLLRDIVHMVGGGHDPIGFMGTAMKGLGDFYKDVSQGKWDRHHMGAYIEHAFTMAGIATGRVTKEMGRLSKYAYNLAAGEDRLPRTTTEFGRVIHHGTTKEQKHK